MKRSEAKPGRRRCVLAMAVAVRPVLAAMGG
jgi:hypothetical protein